LGTEQNFEKKKRKELGNLGSIKVRGGKKTKKFSSKDGGLVNKCGTTDAVAKGWPKWWIGGGETCQGMGGW